MSDEVGEAISQAADLIAELAAGRGDSKQVQALAPYVPACEPETRWAAAPVNAD